MKEFLESQGGLVATVLMVVVAFNLLLTGLHQFLGFIKDKTVKWDGDNKAYEAIGKVLSIGQKLIEMLSAAQNKKVEEKK